MISAEDSGRRAVYCGRLEVEGTIARDERMACVRAGGCGRCAAHLIIGLT